MLGRIHRLLHPDSPPTVILLEGNRRAGKTSVSVASKSPVSLPDSVAVYVSFQGVEGDSVKAGIRRPESVSRATQKVSSRLSLFIHHATRQGHSRRCFWRQEELERKRRIEEIWTYRPRPTI